MFQVDYILSQKILAQCEECIIKCKFKVISDLSSKEKYKKDKIERFRSNIYSKHLIENISQERISMRNFFSKIKDSVILIERMNQTIQYATEIKSNWKFINVDKA